MRVRALRDFPCDGVQRWPGDEFDLSPDDRAARAIERALVVPVLPAERLVEDVVNASILHYLSTIDTEPAPAPEPVKPAKAKPSAKRGRK